MTIRISGLLDHDVQLTASGNQSAGLVVPYWFLRGADTMPQVPSSLGWYGPLPMGFLWTTAMNLYSDVVDLQAGDQITHYTIRYQMWQDPVVLP
jgi:hypothetical protein